MTTNSDQGASRAVVFPLRRTGEVGPAGSTVWKSRDERWTFVQEPYPPRQWFAYLDDEDAAANVGFAHLTLGDAAAWASGECLP